MEIIDWEIENLKEELKSLEEKKEESIESIKKNWDSYSTFSDKCEMAYCLAIGAIYEPYCFQKTIRFEIAQEWKTKEYFEYCHIRTEEYGNPSGFISLEAGLFDATYNKHRGMWINSAEDGRTSKSFEDYRKELKNDSKLLIEEFNSFVRERGTGVYSTRPYIIEFEAEKETYYIYMNDN